MEMEVEVEVGVNTVISERVVNWRKRKGISLMGLEAGTSKLQLGISKTLHLG